MTELSDLYDAHSAPQHLEQLYREARSDGDIAGFAEGIRRCFAEFPDNLLYAAWHYRLLHDAPPQAGRSRFGWMAALPLSLLAGAALGALFDNSDASAVFLPVVAALWALGYLALAGGVAARRAALAGSAVAALGVVVLLLAGRLAPSDHRRYIDLAFPHMALLAWGAVGLGLLKLRTPHDERLGFARRSLAILGIGGVCTFALTAFALSTLGMFDALNMRPPAGAERWIAGGVCGFIPLLASVIAHNLPAEDRAYPFGRTAGKLLTVLLRALLPLTLIVLVAYVCAIPFHFMEPFMNRRMLVASNGMLSGVMNLLFGVALVGIGERSPRGQAILRGSVMAVAALAALSSLYTLSAIVYRTMSRAITINRVAGIGWNVVSISLLLLLIYRWIRGGPRAWLEALRATFADGMLVYLAWALALMLALPALFIGR